MKKRQFFKMVKQIKDAIIGFFSENIGLKMVAVIITLTLFVLVAGESVQISKRVSIEYQVPDALTIINEVPNEFEMVLSGPKSAIAAISNQDLVYKVELFNSIAGPSRIRINPRRLGLPSEIIILSVSPSMIYPVLDDLVEKVVPITLVKSGEMDGRIVRSITLKPEYVKISGPHQIIKNIEDVKTELLDLSKITKSKTLLIRLKVPAEKVIFVDSELDTIELNIEVSKVKQ